MKMIAEIPARNEAHSFGEAASRTRRPLTALTPVGEITNSQKVLSAWKRCDNHVRNKWIHLEG